MKLRVERVEQQLIESPTGLATVITVHVGNGSPNLLQRVSYKIFIRIDEGGQGPTITVDHKIVMEDGKICERPVSHFTLNSIETELEAALSLVRDIRVRRSEKSDDVE